uniref:Uncharacterized protein n=1 Tax=Anguilla anguilla TaxID=7936 RepID=A0A0E9UJ02_ANGAN
MWKHTDTQALHWSVLFLRPIIGPRGLTSQILPDIHIFHQFVSTGLFGFASKQILHNSKHFTIKR